MMGKIASFREACRVARTWRGSYARLSDVPRRGPGFDGEEWLRQSRLKIQEMLEARRWGVLPSPLAAETSALSVLCAALAREREVVRVLDFGGGLGFGFVPLSSALPRSARIDYHVVETPRVCEEGRTLFSDEPRVHFYDAIPDPSVVVDAVYVSSALQYVDEYAAVLEKLLARRPSFVLMSKLSAVSGPTFAAGQVNVPGSVIPYWFINRDELIGWMSKKGYQLSYQALNGRIAPVAASRSTWDLLFSQQPVSVS
jgi:putative methyltransferase (TIGR04325 family)